MTDEPGQNIVTESQFYMWRAIFAMAHADEVITDEEMRFMLDTLGRLPFSMEQRDILEKAIIEPEDVTAMFHMIDDPNDRSRFFYFARMLCWCDGDFDAQEQKIMTELKKVHIETVNVDAMIGHVDLQLEDDDKKQLEEDMRDAAANDGAGGFFRRFLDRFT